MLFLGVLTFFGASLVALGLAPHLVGFAGVVVLLVLVNAAGGLSDFLAQSLMQLGVPAQLRAGPAARRSRRSGWRARPAPDRRHGIALRGEPRPRGERPGLVALAGAAALWSPRLRRL